MAALRLTSWRLNVGFTLVGFAESQDSAVLVNVAAIPDPHVTVQADDVIVPAAMSMLSCVCAVGLNITRAQVRSPTVLRMFPFEVSPINRAAVPATHTPFPNFFRNPIQLDPAEALNFQAAEDGAGAIQSNGLIWLSDGNVNPMAGEIFTIRATGTTTVTGFAWSNCPLVLDENLPAGTYAVVGMRVESATAIAGRLVFVGGSWRPGVIGYAAVASNENEVFRYGALGNWGEFRHDQPPTADLLCTGADSAQTVFLDLIKVA